ncbi:MAG: type II secretion system protein [Candidatus Paceibacterota bacterium]|jgi:prepilin-type N-terminal cleavage/methylation domain-containing protein
MKFFLNKKGFTLIELLVVVAIIGLLSSVVLASLNSSRAKTRDAKRLSELRQIVNALELYAIDNGGIYPSTGNMNNVYIDLGCPQTITALPDLKTADWVPGLAPTYIPALPQDPKPISSGAGGGCYMYSSNGNKYLLSAYGTVEASSNGGKMDSNFGYRELSLMNAPSCYYSTSYPSIDNVKRKSFTYTNLTTNDFTICPKIGP